VHLLEDDDASYREIGAALGIQPTVSREPLPEHQLTTTRRTTRPAAMTHNEAVALLEAALEARPATDDELDDLATLDVIAWNKQVDSTRTEPDPKEPDR
jgi:hypothetical protein